jgi:tRNA U34 2-thiouridine synthase MnmA/TrmU
MKALALFSGGLDSILAIKLIEKQGIEVIAVNFSSPFHTTSQNKIKQFAKKHGIKLKTIELGNDYLKILRNPKHGYGKNMNPCLDCRIFMLKKAKAYAKKIGASFIITGEVLNERPMTQTKNSLDFVEKKSGLKGKLLRPLSAKLLPETIFEKKGKIDRTELYDISGRKRDKQFKLAKKFKIKDYPHPGGGCLLTYKEFSAKVKDLFDNKKRINEKDIELLKIGRHFRFEKNKIIVGRNEDENKKLLKIKNKTDYYFEVPDVGSPITIIQGPKTKEGIKKAASLTASYSDSKKRKVLIYYGKDKLNKTIKISPMAKKTIKKLRIT